MPLEFTPFSEDRPVRIYRTNLPHWRQDGCTYFITFRLADSSPQEILDVWQSGTLPYAALFAAQIAIVAVQIWVIARTRRGPQTLSTKARRAVFVIGSTYFSFMVFRLIAGATFANEHSWFDAPVPSTFHLVLAAFAIISAHEPGPTTHTATEQNSRSVSRS